MSKHTPGPWSHKSPDEVSIHDAEGGRIGILTFLRGALGMSGRRDFDEVIANARLIAAAPELLEACKKAEGWLSGWASAEPYIDVLRAAIAKATGEAS